MDRWEIEDYVLLRASRALGMWAARPREDNARAEIGEFLVEDRDRADILADLDEILADLPDRPDALARLRDDITFAVCIKVLTRRGEPANRDRTDAIASAIASPPGFVA